ncbi:MAG: hypothetical protein ACOC7T_00460 [Planctomycetota bacterium]
MSGTPPRRPVLPLRAVLMVFCVGLFLAPVVLAAQPTEQSAEPDSKSPRTELKEGAARLKERARQKVGSFAQYADGYFNSLTENAALAWIGMAVAAVLGAVSAMYGWTLIKSLLVPFAPVWGLATGGASAFCIIQAFYTGRPFWWRLLVLAVGITAGLALYLFSALRAKPVAAFLVILSPFLILAVFLFPQQNLLGLVIFCAGLLAGFAAMVEVRPLAIISTSLLGSGLLLAAYGILARLTGKSGPLKFVRGSFDWLIEHPLMLLLVWGVVAFMGLNFQFTTGPKGTLED